MKNLLILLVLSLVLTSCSDYSENNEEYSIERDVIINIDNPYSQGTGHYAGYEWAERKGGACNGNSDSFNEGCEEYYR
ncbi:hypothetical protein HON22_04395 [Candidatus Peregrinibacteria bacterium]|nr:hypothetical protein [Candidatus Peregrinibacteria bacterium]